MFNFGRKNKEDEKITKQLEKLKEFNYPLMQGKDNYYYFKKPYLCKYNNKVTEDNILAEIEDCSEEDIVAVCDKLFVNENKADKDEFILKVLEDMENYPEPGEVKLTLSDPQLKRYPILANTRCVYFVKVNELEFFHYIGKHKKVIADLSKLNSDQVRSIIKNELKIVDCREKEQFTEDVIKYVGCRESATIETMQVFEK